jgi:hypothetical protein
MKEVEEDSVDPKQAVINFRRTVIPLVQSELGKKNISLSQRELARCLDCSQGTITTDLKAINSE